MSRRAIIVDSGSAPTGEFLARRGVALMPMNLHLDGETRRDGVEITRDAFYRKAGKLREFSTSSPTVWQVLEIYEALRDQGAEEIIDIHFSSKMTRTAEICRRAKEMIAGVTLCIVDTENVAMGAYLIAEKLVALLQSGLSPADALNRLPVIRSSTWMQISVTTLKYLIKNGRVGRARGLAGALLNVRPVLGVEAGEIAPLTTVRGLDRVCQVMAENALEFLRSRPHDIKIFCAYGADGTMPYMEKTRDLLVDGLSRTNFSGYRLIEDRVWPTIACHSGPEVFGLAVYGEKTPIA